MDLPVYLNPLKFNGWIWFAKVLEAILFWLFYDEEGSNESWHISGSLPWQHLVKVPEVVQVVDLLAPYDP